MLGLASASAEHEVLSDSRVGQIDIRLHLLEFLSSLRIFVRLMAISSPLFYG